MGWGTRVSCAALLIAAAASQGWAADRCVRGQGERRRVELMPQQVPGWACWNPVAFTPDGGRLLAATMPCTDAFEARGYMLTEWEVSTGNLLRIIPLREQFGGTAFYLGDGRRALVRDGTDIAIWDLDAGSVARRQKGRRVSYPGSGTRVLLTTSGDEERTEDAVMLWDFESDQRWPLALPRDSGYTLLADGKTFLLAHGGRLELRDATTSTAVRVLAESGPPVRAVQELPGGGVAVARTNKVEVWSADGRLQHSFEHGAEVEVVALDRGGGRLLASTDWYHQKGPPVISVWDLSTGARVSQFASPASMPWNVRLAAAGDRLVVVYGQDRVANLHDLASGKLLHSTALGWLGGRTSPDLTRMVTTERGLRIVDPLTGAKLVGLGGRGETPVGVRLGGKRLFVDWGDGVQIWDLDALRPTARFGADTGNLVVSADGTIAATAAAKTGVSIWRLDGRVREQRHPLALEGDPTDIELVMSADGGRVLWRHRQQVGVIDVAAGRPAFARTFPRWVTNAQLSPDGSRLVVDLESAPSEAVDPATGKTLGPASPSLGREGVLADGGLLFTVEDHVSDWGMDIHGGSVTHSAQLFELDGGKSRADWYLDRDQVTSSAVTADGRRGLLGLNSGELLLFDLQHPDAQPRRLPGHRESVYGVAFSADGRYVVSRGADRTIRIRRLDGDASVTLAGDGREWIAYTDDGYFDASRNGGSLVMVSSGSRTGYIDQLALRNNRPDLLLSRLGFGSAPLIAHLQAQHRRRLAKAGISEDALSMRFEDAPVATIADVTVAGKRATITGELRDACGLDHYQIHVNDVPVLGPAGRRASGPRQAVREVIELGPGPNKIELSVVNDAGVESLRAFRNVDYAGPPVSRDLYFLAFGVSRYRDPALDLTYAHKDALDLGALFGSMRAGFDHVHVRTYVDEQVTVAAIREARAFLAGSKVDDVVVLFIAGHGTYGRDAAADYYFVTHDADPTRIEATAASFTMVEELLQGIPARKKLFLMDTCESGEREEGVAVAPIGPGGRGIRARTTRTLVFRPADARPRPFLFDRDRYIYNDLFRRSGAVVVSSSRGSELSYELDQLQNGAFTEAIITAFTSGRADTSHDGSLSTAELRAFLGPAVADLTHGRQHPTVDRDNLTVDMGFPVLKNLRLPAVASRPPRSPHGCGCAGGWSAGGAMPLILALGLLFGHTRRRRASPRVPTPRRRARGPRGRLRRRRWR